MKIAICEDEVICQDKLETLIHEYHNDSAEIIKSNSGEDLLEYYRKGFRFHVGFLDVRMKKLDGIETAKLIREYDKEAYIILTTSLIEYAIKGYSIKVNDFILKPINKLKYKEVIERYQREIKKTKEKKYIINVKGEVIAINIDDIYYIESDRRKVEVNTINCCYEYYRSISDEERLLKNYGFIRPHRSYLVNMKNIHRIKPTEIILANNVSIPLSSKRYKVVYDEFTRYITGREK